MESFKTKEKGDHTTTNPDAANRSPIKIEMLPRQNL